MRKFRSGLKPAIKHTLHHFKSKTLAEVIDHAETWELEQGQPKFPEKKNGVKNIPFRPPNPNMRLYPREEHRGEPDFPKKQFGHPMEAPKFREDLYPKSKQFTNTE